MAEIKLNGVYKSYGSTDVIHGVDLCVQSGDFVVFVGPSGCGKSTLLRIIAGLETVSAGTVEIDGQVVNDISASDRGLAMVFQSYALYPHMSVYKNMSFGLENTKMAKAEIDKRVRAAADMLQITAYLERKPKALSGGQRQRVAIGRAIVRNPKAFLFDEPLSNLDAELRVTMRKELSALHQKIGGTMIYVTHDQTEAMTLADNIVVLQDGLVEQAGKPLALYNYPSNVFVAGFIGSPRMNLFKAKLEFAGNHMTVVSGASRFPVESAADRPLPQGDVTIGVRPEHLEVTGPENADISVTVEFAEQLGGETYLYCSAEGIPQLTVHQLGQLPMDKGTLLHLKIDRVKMHVFDADGKIVVSGLKP